MFEHWSLFLGVFFVICFFGTFSVQRNTSARCFVRTAKAHGPQVGNLRGLIPDAK